MKTKSKIAIIAVIAVLTLALIGTAVALVLVASRATVSNTMTISYQAINVNAEIEAIARIVGPDKSTTTLLIDDGGEGLSKGTVTFVPSQSEASGGFTFKHASIPAGGYVEYIFKITNNDEPNYVEGTYTEDGYANNEEIIYIDTATPLGVLVNTTGETADDNVKVSIGKRYYDVDQYFTYDVENVNPEMVGHEVYSLTEKSSEFLSIRPAEKTATIILRLEPDNLSHDANLSLGFNIQLGKDLTYNSLEREDSKVLSTNITHSAYTGGAESMLTLDVYGRSTVTVIDSKYIDMSTRYVYPLGLWGAELSQTLDVYNNDISVENYSTIYFVYTLTHNRRIDAASMTLDKTHSASGYTYKIGTSMDSLTAYSSSNKTISYGEIYPDFTGGDNEESILDEEAIPNTTTFVISVSSTNNFASGLHDIGVSFNIDGFYTPTEYYE